MTRRRTSKTEVSMFPFLSVLCAVIGILMLMMIVIIGTRVVADEPPPPPGPGQGSLMSRDWTLIDPDDYQEKERRIRLLAARLVERRQKCEQLRRSYLELASLIEAIEDKHSFTGNDTDVIAGRALGRPVDVEAVRDPTVATVVTKTPISVEINAEGFVVYPEKRQYPLEDLKKKRSPLQEFLQGVDRAREKQYLLLLVLPNGIAAYGELNTHLKETYPSEDPLEKGELSRIDVGVEPFSRDWALIGTK